MCGSLRDVSKFHWKEKILDFIIIHVFVLVAKFTYASCIPKKDFDEINAVDGKCVNHNTETSCVCTTDLCNDANKDEDSGIGLFVPESTMIFLISMTLFYFFM